MERVEREVRKYLLPRQKAQIVVFCSWKANDRYVSLLVIVLETFLSTGY